MLPLSEVQTAIYDALTPALAPVPVVDFAGPNQPYPYATIGEFIAAPADTLAEQGADMELTVHLWSRQPGMQECQQMMTLAKDTLDRAVLPADGFQWVTTIWQNGQTLREPDGLTRHGILRFRVMTFEAAEVLQLAGTVNTNGTDSVVWGSGDKFTSDVQGKTITIAGADYTIVTYFSAIQVMVDPPVPTLAGAAYVILL